MKPFDFVRLGRTSLREYCLSRVEGIPKFNMLKLGKYRHFKGDLVEVIGTALHSETLEEFIIYKHLTGKHAGEENYWVRPIKMFLEEVEFNGKKMPRFEIQLESRPASPKLQRDERESGDD